MEEEERGVWRVQQLLAVRLSCNNERLSLLWISVIYSAFAAVNHELSLFSVCFSLTFPFPLAFTS